jgi:hypothetical protein
MRTLALGRFALSMSVAVALLVGCGGSQPPIGAPGAMPQPAAIDPATASGDLLYAGTENDLFVYSYPQAKFVSEVSLPAGGGGQVCSDSDGDVYAPVFTNETNETVEYAHGGTQPIATLDSPPGFRPYSCAIDPKTGNLAVTDFLSNHHGKVAIYQGAQGSAKVYTDHGFTGFFYCTYDDDGNLFLTGFTKGYNLAELPAGRATFTNILVSKKIAVGGFGIQWDGKYVTLAQHSYNRGEGKLYRVAINGARGKIVGVTYLDDSKSGAMDNQYWIQGNIVIWPTSYHNGHLGLWNYPSGRLRKIIHRHFTGGVGSATVSVAP